MIRNGLAQFGNAHHGRVLVVAGAHGGVHFLEAGVVDGEDIVDLEQAAVFEERFVEAAVALVEPPGGGFAQAVDEPWRDAVGRVGFLGRVIAEGAAYVRDGEAVVIADRP
mgnify:CR=1 FL=1